jgi:hypothetical protein
LRGTDSKLTDVKLIDTKLNDKMYGDIFEALMAAINKTVNSIVPGVGYQCGKNVYNLLTRDIILDRKHARGNPKTLVQELFGAKSTKEHPSKGMYLPSQGLSVEVIPERIGELQANLTKYGSEIKLPNKIYNDIPPRGWPVDRQTAVTYAYSSILDKLAAIGLTPEEYENIKQSYIISKHALKQKILDKMNDYGDKIALVKKNSDIPGYLDWHLVITHKGKKEWFAKITVTHDTTGFDEAKKKLLTKYAEERRVDIL